MKTLKRIFLLSLVLLTVLPAAVGAAPYTTYTYDTKGENMLISPDVYVPDEVVDTKYAGINDPTGDNETYEPAFEDIFVGPDLKVYLVDSKYNRLIIMDRYYKVEQEITTFRNDYGVWDTFSGPCGVFVNEDSIYVCDTEKSRIVMFDTDGNFKKIVEQPESNLFDEGSLYKPVACAVDDYGRIFVISRSTYQGVIVINDDADFFGFIGAQSKTLSAWEIFRRRFKTEEQLAAEADNVSLELKNISIDSQNFIYVTTTAIAAADQEAAVLTPKENVNQPVKKLNAAGEDVMRRNAIYAPSGEVRFNKAPTAPAEQASQLVDVGIGPVGTWTVLDQRRSRMYTYDENGNLLFAFGDKGMSSSAAAGTSEKQNGNLSRAVGVVYQGSKLLALDAESRNFVVYRRTEYGNLLIGALENDAERRYDMATDDWTEILKRNVNYDIAYLQLGKAAHRNGDYEAAMKNFKAIYNTAEYSTSWTEVRSNWASKYFWIIPIIVVAVFVLLSKFFGYAAKVNKRAALKIGRKSLKEEVLYAFHIIFHPFDGFWDLKHEKRGSMKSAFIILLVTIVAFFYRSVGTGYIHSPDDSEYLTILGNIAAVLVPLLLWVIANWCFTTLFEGEGSLTDIFKAACYSLTPLPIIMIPTVIASQFLNVNEAGILSLLYGLAFVWMGLLLVFGMMITHDYSFIKNILCCLVTIVGMMFIMFIALLFSTLMAKIVSFISNIAIEINYRV